MICFFMVGWDGSVFWIPLLRKTYFLHANLLWKYSSCVFLWQFSEIFMSAIFQIIYRFLFVVSKHNLLNHSPNWSTAAGIWYDPLIFFLFLSRFSFTRRHSRISGQQRRGSPISTLLYHFQPRHEHLDISWAVAAESSLMHIVSDRIWNGNSL